MFFEKQYIHLQKIYKVVSYAPRKYKRYTYPGTLPSYELMYVYEGEYTLKFGKHTISVSTGDVIYLPKGLEDNSYSISVKESHSLYTIYFDTQDEMPMEPVHIAHVDPKIGDQFKKIYGTWMAEGNNYYYLTMRRIYDLFIMINDTRTKYLTSHKLSYLDAADQYITAHFCEPDFDYSKLVEASGISYSYFKKLFISKYGCPPVKYVTRLRMKRACELLDNEELSITEVAQLCGYDNLYYFSTVFKNQIGMSPKKYSTLHAKILLE